MNFYGISMMNSESNTVNCNNVRGIQTFQPVDHPDASMRFINSPSNIISCNASTNMSRGYVFHHDCRNGFTKPTIFRDNDIGYHYYGLLYTASARVDAQINEGNNWLSLPLPGWKAKNFNESLDGFLFAYEVDYYECNSNSLPNQVFPNQWFLSNALVDKHCDLNNTHHGLCYANNTHLAAAAENYEHLINIARDLIVNSEFNEETNWQMRVQLYEMLLENPDLINESNEFVAFYAQYAGTTVQRVAEMNIERENIFANQSTLMQIVNDNSILIYQKAVELNNIEELIIAGELPKDSLVIVKEGIMESMRSIAAFNDAAMLTLDSTLSAEVDLISDINQSNTGQEVYELNDRIVNEIYLSGVVENNPDVIFDNAAPILNIAMQCPLAGGPAVYRARELYSVIDPTMSYNDDLACVQSGYLYRLSRNTTGKSKLFPNPAYDEITIVYNITENSSFQILDATGRIVSTHLLNSESISKTIDVSDVESGMYLYRITDDKKMIDTGQFIIQK